MAQAKLKPLYDPQTDIEDDFFGWCFEQAELLRQKRFAEVDLPNIIEELESMGRNERLALLSNYTIVLLHLLKWRHQPERRNKSWRLSLKEHWRRIEKLERSNPSLRSQAAAILSEAYADARSDAADETDLPLASFPADCPFALDQIRDLAWLPA